VEVGREAAGRETAYRARVRASNLRALLAAIWADPRGRKWLLLSQGALVGQVIFDLAIPLAIRQIVNNGILAGNFDKVIEGALYMAVFAIASMLFATACSWYAARVGEEVGHRLRVNLYRKVTQLSWGNIDRLETSDLLVRLTTDINQVRPLAGGGGNLGAFAKSTWPAPLYTALMLPARSSESSRHQTSSVPMAFRSLRTTKRSTSSTVCSTTRKSS